MKKILFTILIALLIIWFGVSYIEIIAQNSMPNPQYMNCNLIIWIIEILEKFSILIS